MQSFRQTIGEIFIIFSFFILFNFESEYVQYVVNKENIPKCTQVYTQSEDGTVYYLVNKFVKDPRKSRIITFVIIPFTL